MCFAKWYTPLMRPLAYLYGLGVSLRNFAFDHGILSEHSYPIPIICVGNITAGGTGKTPHVEYLLGLLTPKYRVAVLSRGYGRKTKGLRVAQASSTAREIGDEPRQIKLKYPEVLVIIDGNRRRAMRYLLDLPRGERPEVVVMDDGYQHRYIKPSYRMLLMDYSRRIYEDKLLPEGRLREPFSARYRADCLVVTKCPEDLSPIESRVVMRGLNLFPYQRMYFTSITYEPLKSLLTLGQQKEQEPIEPKRNGAVYLISGIANPRQFVDHLEQEYTVVKHRKFPDHHTFTKREMQEVIRDYCQLAKQHKELMMVTTEKDAVRLTEYLGDIPDELLQQFYYLPIAVELVKDAEAFDKEIMFAAGGLCPDSKRYLIE